MEHTMILSVFLPHTLFFQNKKEEKPITPPRSHVKRAVSVVDLPSRVSAPNLLSWGTRTPESEDSPFTTEVQRLTHYATPGDPRSLVRNDAEVSVWGREPVFNQPRSRAGPHPSGSISDFAKVHEDLQRLTLKKPKKSKGPSTPRTPGYEQKNWTVERALQGNAGLTNAIYAASGDSEVLWIGTLGFPTDALPLTTREDISDHMLNEYQSEVVYVGDKDLDGHYTGFCKTILWPIFHYQVPDHPKSKAYADHSWKYYLNVNQAFADKAVESYKVGDTIWVHDYHLLLVPGKIRQKLPNAQIGLFLHSAFPSSEIFRCLAKRKELLEGMLGANLVAFQTEEYMQHFLQTCSRLLTVETMQDGVQLESRFVNVMSHPIGINPQKFQEARQVAEVQDWVAQIKKKYSDKLLIVARDKLDNIHGVRQKLLAYEIFLKKYPEWAGKVVMIQVALSTSEQNELLTSVYDICNRIDSAHSDLIHQPYMFLKQDIGYNQYLGLLTAADILMVSTLRDGMNLTAHEFVFCQDGHGSNNKFGPVILSEFTGAASIFHDQISINPWDFEKQADAIKIALEMTATEKERRWKSMHTAVLDNTGSCWAQALEKALKKVHEEHHKRAPTSVPRLSAPQISEKYKQAKHRIFFIDYEGTLASQKTREGIPLVSPTRIVDVLNDLMTDPKNVVYIMSGLEPEELNRAFRTATGLGLIAENGCFISAYGAAQTDWKQSLDLHKVRKWKKAVKGILQYYLDRMEGSYLEERYCSILFRYEKFEDQENAARQAGECADQITDGCKHQAVHAVPVHKAVLIEQYDHSKGTAAKHIYNGLRAKAQADGTDILDFMMVVGDDREDEVVFRLANEMGKKGEVQNVFTVSVGKRNTEAQAAITQGSTGLLTVLQKLAKISMDEVDD